MYSTRLRHINIKLFGMYTVQAPSKLKDVYLIVKCGFTGAIALTGICILLILLGSVIRTPFITHLYGITFAKCSFKGLCIGASGLGFILGVILRRRLPFMQKGIVPIAVAAIPLIIGVWLLNAYTIRASIPHAVKLADCTNSTVNLHLKVPKGHAYQLELITPAVKGMPDGTVTSSYKFSGTIRISNGTTSVADFPISSDKSWLTASCFVLTGVGSLNGAVPPLSQFIQPQKDYDVQITLNPPPPPSTAIWLYWLQSKMDTDK